MSDKQPNFLLLFPDEQRHDTIAAAGYPWMITPNLDRLVNEGCLFPNGHTPNPVCVPARHCLITGTSGRYHGFFSNAGPHIKRRDLATLPDILSDNDYYSVAVGKMHFKPACRHNGFLEMHLMEEIPGHYSDDAYLQYLADVGLGDARAIHGIRPYLWNEPQVSPIPDEHHPSKWVADKAIEVLDQRDDRPFFLMCGFIAPHPPFNVPHKLKGIYKDRDIPASIEPARFEPYFTGKTPWQGDFDSPEERRKVQEAYLSMITHVDEQVGRILDYLEEIGELDNTFIIYTSDHGEMLGDHGDWGKCVYNENSVKVPFICRYPKHFQPGSRDKRFVDLYDILPTFLDAAGIDLDDCEDQCSEKFIGASFLKPESEHRDFNYQWCEFGDFPRLRWVMMRDQRYKYVFFHNGGFERFFDLKNDPQELHDLFGTPELPEADFHRLKEKCIAMETKWGPEGAVVDGEMVVTPHNPPLDASKRGNKFVLCGFDQLPEFGRKSPAEEAKLFAEDFKKATADIPAERLNNLAPDDTWQEKWHEYFLDYGGTEELWQEMMRIKE